MQVIRYILKRNLEVAKGNYENAEKPEIPYRKPMYKKEGIRKPQTFQKFCMTPRIIYFFIILVNPSVILIY